MVCKTKVVLRTLTASFADDVPTLSLTGLSAKLPKDEDCCKLQDIVKGYIIVFHSSHSDSKQIQLTYFLENPWLDHFTLHHHRSIDILSVQYRTTTSQVNTIQDKNSSKTLVNSLSYTSSHHSHLNIQLYSCYFCLHK